MATPGITSERPGTTATYLDHIVAHHRRRAAADPRSLDAVIEAALAESATSPPRGFRSALVAAPGNHARVHVIAEVKRRSPSKGIIRPHLDPGVLAGAYQLGGASCVSVLTDEPHFGGSAADLVAARTAITIPVLRKDFTVDARDVADARAMGADCCLLIAAVLDDEALEACLSVARAVGIDALVEVHDEAEAARAMASGADLIGVNQRDLVTFAVDTERAIRVAQSLPTSVVRVAESGVEHVDAAARLANAGYHAILVGEALVRSDDPAGLVQALAMAKESRA